jgi:hypothetical protein
MKMFLNGNIMPLFANFSRGIVPYPPICPPLNPEREGGVCLHPRLLSQNGRGELALTPEYQNFIRIFNSPLDLSEKIR